MLIKNLGGELLVNNSWSGSRVTKLPGAKTLFPSGCSDERTKGLHTVNAIPDIIIVYLGTNDWAYGVKNKMPKKSWLSSMFKRNDPNTETDFEEFYSSYLYMLRKIRYNYPVSQVFCCSLNSSYMPGNTKFVFPKIYNGNNIEDFNCSIKEAAMITGSFYLDLYSSNIPYASFDGTHATRDGMETLAGLMYKCLFNG